MIRRRCLATAFTALALAVGATGCGGESDPGNAAASPTRSSAPTTSTAQTGDVPEPGADCLEPADHANTVRFGPRGAIGGYVMGSGSRYVVLAHQSMGDSCQMLPLARGLAEAGYRTLAFDFPGASAGAAADMSVADSVLAAVAYCRGHEAGSVSLVGASMGGYAVLAAALKADPPVRAVVSLSAPAVWDDPQGNPVDIARLQTPTQLWAGRYDTRFADDAKALARAQPAAALIIVPNLAHGVELVPDALPRVVAFLDQPR